MQIKLKLNWDVNKNAEHYFSKAKKLKAKIPGVEKTIDRTKKEIDEFELRKKEYLDKKEHKKKIELHKKKEWYEKFRFTWTSSGLLFVIGKDAGTNEILIKKHAENEDLIFHSEAPGSPFGILKKAKSNSTKQDYEEAAQFLLCFSKQWKGGYGTGDAFYVDTEQVTKKAQSGEYMNKGSFMVYGNKNILKNIQLLIGIGIRKEKINTEDGEITFEEPFSGSVSACKKYCENRFVKIEPGHNKYKALNKEIQKRLKFKVDDLPKYIPNECKILKK